MIDLPAAMAAAVYDPLVARAWASLPSAGC